MKERLKDSFPWAGFGGLLFWDLGLDLLSYLYIGVGVVSGYQGAKKNPPA